MVTSRISPEFVDPYVMDNGHPSVVTVEYVRGPPITSVTFYKEMETSTTLIGTVSSPPWSTTVTAYEIATGGLITVKALVKSSSGKSAWLLTRGASHCFGNWQKVRFATILQPSSSGFTIVCTCLPYTLLFV